MSHLGCGHDGRSDDRDPRFDAIVLLSVPEDVLLERVASRRTNDYGKTEAERALILSDLRAVEPLLRAGATTETDTRKPVHEVADLLEFIAGRVARATRPSRGSSYASGLAPLR